MRISGIQDAVAGFSNRFRRWLLRFPRALPVAVFLLIAGITIFSIFAIERGEQDQRAAEMRNRAIAVGSALERRANSSAAYLRAGAAYIASLNDLPADDFRRFVSELRLDEQYRGSEGIGWAEAIYPAEVDRFDALLAEEYGGQAVLHPRPTGEFPLAAGIAYLEPDTARNRLALGFDMYSEPVRRAAMREAEITARPTASGKVVLMQEGGREQPGFIITMPVFEQVNGGRRLKGFIYSPFNAADFLQAALDAEDAQQYNIRLFDGSPADGTLLAARGDAQASRRTAIYQLQVAGRPWSIAVQGNAYWGLSGLSKTTAVFGLLVGVLLALLLRMMTRQAMEDEISLRRFQEQASIRNSLTRELNHRVKNTLANVLSIIALTRRRATGLDDFADGLDGRIRALSATHDLLTQSDWGATPVQSVVQAELRPYAHDADHAVEMQGPDVQLAPNDALSLGLAMHELATNASKYGALSRPGGRVTVFWKLVSDTLVRIEWLERGGPEVKPQRGRGFGTDLIERIVAHELKNPVKLEFEREGVRCVLTIPVRKPGEFVMRAGKNS